MSREVDPPQTLTARVFDLYNILISKMDCPPGVDPAVWAALPEEIKAEYGAPPPAAIPDDDDRPNDAPSVAGGKKGASALDDIMSAAAPPDEEQERGGGSAPRSSNPWAGGGRRLSDGPTSASPSSSTSSSSSSSSSRSDDDEPPGKRVRVQFWSDAYTVQDLGPEQAPQAPQASTPISNRKHKRRTGVATFASEEERSLLASSGGSGSGSGSGSAAMADLDILCPPPRLRQLATTASRMD